MITLRTNYVRDFYSKTCLQWRLQSGRVPQESGFLSFPCPGTCEKGNLSYMWGILLGLMSYLPHFKEPVMKGTCHIGTLSYLWYWAVSCRQVSLYLTGGRQMDWGGSVWRRTRPRHCVIDVSAHQRWWRSRINEDLTTITIGGANHLDHGQLAIMLFMDIHSSYHVIYGHSLCIERLSLTTDWSVAVRPSK